MKSISIYTITRNQNIEQLQKLERQLSGREYFLKMREWELESMKALTAELETCMEDVYALHFFYSFQIPRLGKEFDLLQIKEDQIVNIELKSGVVSDEAIRRQLLQNRYYLSVLGRTIHSYTYISSQNRLVRLTNHDHIAEADWDELCRALKRESPDYDGNIEELFRAELYLISPLREPERFLQKEYFLTAQQRDIERQILKGIRAKHSDYYWFSGLPGTGKTLLLYDLAMKLSVRQRVCMIHCGESGEDWRILHKRLRRIDFLSDRQLSLQAAKQTMTENVCAEEAFDTFLKPYSAILVDEAHLLSVEQLKILEECKKQIPIIFSSDTEDMISPEELDREIPQRLAGLPDVQSFHLTNRIRTNAELSSFIQNMMDLSSRKGKNGYPNIEVVYANDDTEAVCLMQGYARRGYLYQNPAMRDVNRLVAVLDEQYYYDEDGYLRAGKISEASYEITRITTSEGRKSNVRLLFHQLNQAKEKLAIVIKDNPSVYDRFWIYYRCVKTDKELFLRIFLYQSFPDIFRKKICPVPKCVVQYSSDKILNQRGFYNGRKKLQ